MASTPDKKLSIAVVVDGAGEAAAQLGQVDAALGSLAKTVGAEGTGTAASFGSLAGQMDQAADASEKVTDAAKEAAKALGDLQDKDPGSGDSKSPKKTEARDDAEEEALKRRIELNKTLLAQEAELAKARTRAKEDAVAQGKADQDAGERMKGKAQALGAVFGSIGENLAKFKEVTGATGDLGAVLSGAATAANSFSAGLETFATTGNIAAAATATVSAGIGDCITAYKNMRAEQEKVNQAPANFIKLQADMKRAVEETDRAIRSQDLANYFASETRQFSRMVAEVRSLRGVVDATQDAENAQRKVVNDEAVRRGADPAKVAVEETLIGAKQSAAELARQGEDMNAELAGAQRNATEATRLFREDRKNKGEGAPATKESKRRMEEADIQREIVEKKIELLPEHLKQLGIKLEAETTGEINRITEGSSSRITATANTALDIFEAEAARTKNQLRTDSPAVFDQLVTVLNDKYKDSGQAELIESLIKRLASDQAISQDAAATMRTSSETVKTIAAAVQAANNDLAETKKIIAEILPITRQNATANRNFSDELKMLNQFNGR